MNILIADDHAMVRQGIIEMLKSAFPFIDTHQVSDGGEAIKAIGKSIWDVILLDISMPIKDGIEVLKQLQMDRIFMPVIIISMQPEDDYGLQTLKLGASGYISKANITNELIPAIETVLKGRKYLSPAMAEILFKINKNDYNITDLLIHQKIQVYYLITCGKSDSDIANEFNLDLATISNYRKMLMENLGLITSEELLTYASEMGLFHPS